MTGVGKFVAIGAGGAFATAVFAVPAILEAVDRYADGFWRLFCLVGLVGLLVITQTVVSTLAKGQAHESGRRPSTVKSQAPRRRARCS